MVDIAHLGFCPLPTAEQSQDDFRASAPDLV